MEGGTILRKLCTDEAHCFSINCSNNIASFYYKGAKQKYFKKIIATAKQLVFNDILKATHQIFGKEILLLLS